MDNKAAGFSEAMAIALEEKKILEPDLLAHCSDHELRNELGFSLGHLAFVRQWLDNRRNNNT